MILAAPLVIPFAKAVGISVATLGMAKAADMVNDYIEANPEESMKILSTIVPSIGIGQVFMNKEKISLEDLDEMTDEEAQDLSKEEKAELMKQAGKTGGSNKRQTMIDISEKLGLSGEGKEKQDIEYDIDERYDEGGVEEVSKPKFDYKKFFRNRRADGGRVGFNLGGSLTGPALNIYNSMSAAGYFTDDEIRNAITAAGYEIPDASTPTQPEQVTGIINQSMNTMGSAPVGPLGVESLVSDYKTQTQNRQNRLTNPNKATEFFNKFTGGGQRDIGEMIRTGQVDQRRLAGIPTVGNIIGKALPDKYFDMSLGDQVFTQAMSGYTGPTVFGENTSGLQKDPFGLNVRSGFGNYAEAVGEDFASLRESLTGRLADKYGVEFDEETGLFTGKNAELANKMTNMMRTKFNFRKDQLAAKNRLDSQIKAAEKQRQEAQRIQNELAAAAAAKDKAAALAAIQKQGRQDYNPNIHGRTDYGRDSGGNQSFDFGGGFGIGSDGGPVSNRTGRGRTGYSEGGLASMFAEKK